MDNASFMGKKTANFKRLNNSSVVQNDNRHKKTLEPKSTCSQRERLHTYIYSSSLSWSITKPRVKTELTFWFFMTSSCDVSNCVNKCEEHFSLHKYLDQLFLALISRSLHLLCFGICHRLGDSSFLLQSSVIQRTWQLHKWAHTKLC